MKTIWAVFFIITLCGFGAFAHAEGDLWDVLSKRPDVKITTNKDSEGKTLRTAKLSSGVVFSEGKGGGFMASDNSGLGAVQCAWMIYSETKNLLNLCYKDSHDNYKKAYNKAVDRIDDFIVVNSLTPVTKSKIEEADKSIFEKSHKNTPLKELCASDFLPKTKEDLNEERMRELDKAIDKLLSVPRPPVVNPCL